MDSKVQKMVVIMTTMNPPKQPVFYFDGKFRTWEQAQQRAVLNQAIAVWSGISLPNFQRPVC